MNITERTTATNVDELLEEIEGLILEEPKRYNQELYISRLGETAYSFDSPWPSCGTKACVGGWAVMRVMGRNVSYDAIEDFAAEILGLDDAQANELFDGSAIDNLCLNVDQDIPEIGTQEYARLGVEHIQQFRAKYREQLLATPIVVPKAR